MPEDIRTPITQVLLKENENFALILPKGASGGKEPNFFLYFFKVARRYVLHRTYDSEIVYSSESAEIPAGGTVDFKILGESGLGVEPDLLEIWKERPYRILHFGIGIMPSDVWLYKAVPAGIAQTAWGYKTEPPVVGDKRDYVDGSISPYENPTVATESVLFYKLSMQIGLKNNSGRAIRPSLRLLGAGYDTVQIVEEGLIKKMLRGEIPCRFLTVGGLRYYDYSVPDEWKKGYELSREVVEQILLGV